MRYIWNDDRKKRTGEIAASKEKRTRKRIRRAILTGLAILLAGAAAGGVALHQAQTKQLKERREELERQEETQARERREAEENKTPQERQEEEISKVREQAREDGCPESLLSLLDKNPETIDFVRDYKENLGKAVPDTVEAVTETGNDGIPHYLQWDERWGYSAYGTSTIAASGCGPTCMSMVAVGLTGDVTATPYRMAKYSEEHGYLDEGNNTYWAFMESAAKDWGLNCTEGMLDEASLASELQAGHPVICSMGPGDFTDAGHFIVLTGYENGQVRVNDPFSNSHTQKSWNYVDISSQIREMWVFYKN